MYEFEEIKVCNYSAEQSKAGIPTPCAELIRMRLYGQVVILFLQLMDRIHTLKSRIASQFLLTQSTIMTLVMGVMIGAIMDWKMLSC